MGCAAKALIALLAAGLLVGWGVDCVGVPLALSFAFFALAGVPPSPPPGYLMPWGGAFLGVTLLFLLCGSLFFLLYIPHSGIMQWKTVFKVLTGPIPYPS